MKTPVWVIGFPRCGSASLCEALRVLGWDPIHNPRHWDQLEGHDAAGDVFVTAHWRELYAMFPRSLFVLNTRDFAGWLRSLRRIPGFWRSPLLFDRYHRLRVYSTHRWQERHALARAWERHHADVRQTIPAERLLELPLPFAWEPLCEFLGVPVPDEPFPWLNRRSCRDAAVRV